MLPFMLKASITLYFGHGMYRPRPNMPHCMKMSEKNGMHSPNCF